MRIQQLSLNNFRCFAQEVIDLDHPVVLLEGANGSGKTSVLEALHYLCYLRSFRTHIPRDLIQTQQQSFFVKARLTGEDGIEHELQVGFSGKRRLVKVDQRSLQSFKELMQHYRVLTLTEDDVSLIRGGPEERRTSIDQAQVLFDPDYLVMLRAFRSVVEQRNALLNHQTINQGSYELWSQQLWEGSKNVQQKRMALLAVLEGRINEILHTYFDATLSVEFRYEAKGMNESYDLFVEGLGRLFSEESRMRRSLFGAHLDDFSIHFSNKRSKVYASRGQQKLIAILYKIAQAQELLVHKGPLVFLLDDFMTDFDTRSIETLLTILFSLKIQLIFTCPSQTGDLTERLRGLGAYEAKLTHRIV